jgi:DNA-binding IclR family transcriptional regulator
MSKLTELQTKVINEARSRLFSFDDYVGVDPESVPTDAQIRERGFLWAVQKVVEGTSSKAAPYREEDF